MRHRAKSPISSARIGLLAVIAYIALYIVVVALSLPGAAFLTVAGGFLFGLALGASAAVVGATVGATVIFLVARSALGEPLLKRAGPRAAKLAEGFRADALSYLLFLRLVPAFPFFLVNLVPAFAGVRLGTSLSPPRWASYPAPWPTPLPAPASTASSPPRRMPMTPASRPAAPAVAWPSMPRIS